MPRIIAVHGLWLDRAYPGTSTASASARREQSLSALTQFLALASRAEADHALLLGDTLDRRTVRPATMTALAEILGELPCPVTVVAGSGDHRGPNDPYSHTDWKSNTSAVESGRWSPVGVAGLEVVARSLAHPGESPTTTGLPEGVELAVSPALETPPHGCAVVTTGTEGTNDGAVVRLAPVIADPGYPLGRAAIIDLEAGNLSIDWVDLMSDAPQLVECDVSTAGSTRELLDLVSDASHGLASGSSLVLVGRLGEGVILPRRSEWECGDATVDANALSFELRDHDPRDLTARGEFLRSLAREDLDERSRHQAIAWGLAALAVGGDDT